MESKTITEAIKHMSLPTTGPDTQEEYILTPDEEKQALAYAVLHYAKTLKDPDANERIRKAKEHFSGVSKENLLRDCNSNKHQQIWHHQQALKRKQDAEVKRQELIKKCNANYFFNLIKHNAKNIYEKPLLKNDNTFDYMKVLCYFFSNDPRFETELKLDLNKGLWIRGKTGLGKTFMLQCLQNNELNPFIIHSMLMIAGEVAANGEYQIGQAMKAIDDVGSEQSSVNHWGTKINWFKDFIELYYAESKPFNQLIITTNFDFNQVEQNYGFRVRSRIRDMFNVIDVKGDDLRGKI